MQPVLLAGLRPESIDETSSFGWQVKPQPDRSLKNRNAPGTDLTDRNNNRANCNASIRFLYNDKAGQGSHYYKKSGYYYYK